MPFAKVRSSSSVQAITHEPKNYVEMIVRGDVARAGNRKKCTKLFELHNYKYYINNYKYIFLL